jgi:arylsulfatase A
MMRLTNIHGLLLLLFASPVVAGDRPPNIVLIVADDLGYGDVGCYGSTINQTPHIDALAAEGIRFTDFHSSGPMCSPTRAALLTGRYQQRFGEIFDTAIDGRLHRDRGLPHKAVTVAELLKTQGYATACFGKWHLGYVPPWLPPSQGFDVFRGLGSGDGDFHTHVDRSGNEDWWHNNELEMEDGYTTDLLTRHSVRFIKQHHEEPFFLYVPHLGIHFPWQGPDDPPHRQKGIAYHADKWGVIPNPGDVRPHVKAMIESVDDSVGQIIAALEEFQVDRNTLVVFTSDNGGYLTYGENFRQISSNGALRGQKTELYEGGHRVPTIIRWPGRIEAGVSNAIGHSTDLLPTFGSLAGISDDQYTTDGTDLSSLLFEGQSLPSRLLYWRVFTDHAVRHGPWKLLITEQATELFRLDSDLGEQNNIADQHPQVVQRLTQEWHRWEDRVNASARKYER